MGHQDDRGHPCPEGFDAAAVRRRLKKPAALDLSEQLLEPLPEAVPGFPGINELNLSDNVLSGIPAGTAELANPEVLRVRNVGLSKVHPNLGKLRVPPGDPKLAKLRRLHVKPAGFTELELLWHDPFETKTARAEQPAEASPEGCRILS